jgi:hypothetical protein
VLGFDDPTTDLELRLRITGDPGGHSVRVRAWIGSTMIGDQTWQLYAATTPNEQGFWLFPGAPWPGLTAIGRQIHPTIQFECSLDGGPWKHAGSAAPTRLYVFLRASGFSQRYDLGADKVVQYGAGLNSVGALAYALTMGIASELYYDPSAPDLSPIVTLYSQGRAKCSGNALLLQNLAESAGASARPVLTWGGSPYVACVFKYHGAFGPTLRFLDLPENDGAEANPHFYYHAVTEVGGTRYDASYGRVGLAQADELAPDISFDGLNYHYPPVPGEQRIIPAQQTSGRLPFDVFCVDWSCPH